MLANLFTIVRRELNAYYTSAIAYIAIIVFLSLTLGLYMAPFFTVLSADMRVFFTILPIVLCVFLPAVSMRLWAEERRQNTWELLLTFPMRAYELVLGKFFASLIFYLSALAGTVVLPVMLHWLGQPDFGPILGAYFGSLLLGVFFLSLGGFISALCRDQIVAFMLTLLGCFGFFLAGTEFVVTLAEAAWPGLGTLLAEVVGVTQHYMTFTRGLLVLGDVLYFLIWTAVWLVLNSLFLEIRSRPATRNGFLASVALCLSVGLTANWLLAEQNLGAHRPDRGQALHPVAGVAAHPAAVAGPRAGEPVHYPAPAIARHHALPGTRRSRSARRHAPGRRGQPAHPGGASANG